MLGDRKRLGSAVRFALLSVGSSLAPAVSAAILEVDNINDDPDAMQCTPAPIDCSLRGALRFADANPGPDELILPADTVELSVGGVGGIEVGALDIDTDVTIRGGGRDVSVIEAGPFFDDRAFNVGNGGSLELLDLAVTGFDRADTGNGGAIFVSQDGTARLVRVDLRDNRALVGGGIFSIGSLQLIDSTITGSSATGDSGQRCRGAGVLATAGSVVIEGSTISSNTVIENGGGAGLGLFNVDVTLRDSLIANNYISALGSGGDHRGAGICVQSSTITIDNTVISGNTISFRTNAEIRAGGGAWIEDSLVTGSGLTFTNNRAMKGGGFFALESQVRLSDCFVEGNVALRSSIEDDEGRGGGFFSDQSVMEIGACTFVNNTASYGSAAFIEDVQLGSMTNSTISGHSVGQAAVVYLTDVSSFELDHVTMVNPVGPDMLGLASSVPTITNSVIDGHCDSLGGGSNPASGGGNVVTDSSCVSAQASDEVVPDVMLGPLRNNGGSSPTHLPGSDSPVLDAGVDCSGLDQRGIARAPTCDSGSVERPAVLEVLFASSFESTF